MRLLRNESGLSSELFLVLLTAIASGQETTRVSVDSSGAEGNNGGWAWAISADGRVVVFGSDSTNLVPGDTNGVPDIFVHDRSTGLTERISVSSTGVEGNGESRFRAAVSADGRVVVFGSDATNLVPNDTNGKPDVFVHDRSNGTTERISLDSSGTEGNNTSLVGAISADGRFVVFGSFASNLVPGDTNGVADGFVHDRSTGLTERISVSSTGAEGDDDSGGEAISADGQVVAFTSEASNLVPGDTNGQPDIFVHDRFTGITERISVDSSAVQGGNQSIAAAVSADGQVVAFLSLSRLDPPDTNRTWDVFVRDRSTGLTERVSVDSSGTEGNGASLHPAISADGQVVSFDSEASNFVAGDTNNAWDIFVHHRFTGITERVSVDSSGTEGNASSVISALSAHGQFVVFSSHATNLVAGDTNGLSDAFVHELPCDADASWSNYGAGFPGSNGIPSFTSRADPVLGTRLILDVGNSYGNDTPGLLLFGYQEAFVPTHWGGVLLLQPVGTIPFYVSWLGSSIEADLPDEKGLCGLYLFLQVLEIDPGAAKGVSFTPGLKLLLGH